MSKIITMISMLVIVSMLLAACAQEETATVVPATDVPAMTGEPVTEEPMTEAPETEEPVVTDTAQPAEEETPVGGIPVTGEEEPFLLSNQLDYDVWNGENDQIGEVENTVIDLPNARVSYIYIETGGFLDIGDTESLVPWGALRLALDEDPDILSDDDIFILQFDQYLLEDAPDVDLENDLPAVGEIDEDWDAEVRTFWEDSGIEVSEPVDENGTTELQGVILATDMLASTVGVIGDMDLADEDAVDETERDIANTIVIDDAIVDINTGEIPYIVVNTFIGGEERLIPVPPNQLQWDPTDGLSLETEPSVLADAPFFEDGLFLDTAVDDWDIEFREYWQNQ